MESLKRFDAAVGVRPEPEPVRPESRIPNGLYTLQFPDGSHRTFRIYTKKQDAKFAPGKRIFAILIGPDNTADFEGVGFVDDSGIHVWRSKKGSAVKPSKIEEYAGLVWKLADGEVIDGYELSISKRCLRCNRELTTPESIDREIGPECWRIITGG